ncbi:hypothetical protein P4O66_017088 [Electrophorus voltai]|uniref:Uncharacterized protein n=1 Tax=Electrophorus voltai TaxID=2609070 RepID=A0AAD8YVZ0_9TELE|nr:hypothetical protein P4O66_017088 [Electrophorus voltai]
MSSEVCNHVQYRDSSFVRGLQGLKLKPVPQHAQGPAPQHLDLGPRATEPADSDERGAAVNYDPTPWRGPPACLPSCRPYGRQRSLASAAIIISNGEGLKAPQLLPVPDCE